MAIPLGVVEGFYGRPYTWSERHALVEFLAAEGFDHYLYAPKADRHLRADWGHELRAEHAAQLRRFGAHCRVHHLAWGVGLSPLIREGHDDPAFKDQLLRRVDELAGLDIDKLALLGDDQPGHARLAEQQIAMVDAIRGRFPELRLLFCPTYYSSSGVLDRVFGERPARYLEQLGQGLDSSVDVFWTGPDVCSEVYPAAHLEAVTAALRRRPWIWDNYPV